MFLRGLSVSFLDAIFLSTVSWNSAAGVAVWLRNQVSSGDGLLAFVDPRRIMVRAIIATLFLLLPSYAQAAFVDFEELTHLTRFSLGDSITSGGLVFEWALIGEEPGVSHAVNRPLLGSIYNPAGGTGVRLSFSRLGLNFPLPLGTQHVSLLYGFHMPHAGTIIINGESANPLNGFADLDGTTLGGVEITSTTTIADNIGELHLNGLLNSLIVGGTEFALDNVTIGVPEPSTAALLLAASISLLTLRRHGRV